MDGRQIVLGMGTGRCGTRSLAALLNRQPTAHVSHEAKPLLSWRNSRPSVLAQRFQRMIRLRDEPVVGDVASFYLPYVEEIIGIAPAVRIACLQRPREEVVESFCHWLDAVHPLPTNHWAKKPAQGWHHEPVYTRIFPQYDIRDREEGIRRYWDEYYQRAGALASRFPQNVRIFDWQEGLNTEQGQREILSFCGFPPEQQVLALGIHENKGQQAPRRSAPARGSADPGDPRRCVVLVPFYSHIDPPCDEALRELERRGYPVRRMGGYAAIDQARNKLATEALLDGFEETMWIDADIAFEPAAIERMRSHQLPIVTGVCPKKGKQELALRLLPATKRLVFGKHGGLAEIMYAGTGFLHVRREVYERIQYELELPVCNERFPRPLIPFFHPLIYEDGEGPWYLGEDWSFSERARQCGFPVMADTTIRLWHIGHYRYGWEDAGNKMQRYPEFTLNFPDSGRNTDAAAGVPPSPQGGQKSPLAEPFNAAPMTDLQAAFPWPDERPAIRAEVCEDGLREPVKAMLRRAITNKTRVVVDLGASTGLSTRFLTEQAPRAAVIAVDPWRNGAATQQKSHSVAGLVPYETFLGNCWEYRERVVPLSMTIAEGQRALVERGIAPDMVFLHGVEGGDAVRAALESILRLFPRAIVVGDGWDQMSVCKAVTCIASDYGLRVETNGPAWRLRGVATGHTIVV
jgi:hypothetical protein